MKFAPSSVGLAALAYVLLLLPVVADASPGGRFAAADGIAHIPFTFDNSHILLEARLSSGKVAVFMLDTASNHTLLDSSVAREAGIESSGEVSLRTAAGAVSTSSSDTKELSLPGLDVVVDRMLVMDLNSIAAGTGWRIGGVLGNDALRSFTVQIDYAAKVLTLYRAGVYHAPALAASLPLSEASHGGTVTVPVTLTLPGQPPVDIRCAIDTGASVTILSSPFVDSSGAIQAVGKTQSHPSLGAGNARFDTLMGRISGLKVGPYRFADPVVGLSRATGGLLAGDEFQGILGNDVLERFTVTLDYPHNSLVLEPNASLAKPFHTDASGMVLIARGADLRSFEVIAVEPESPASHSGIQVGDIVERVDGGPAARYDLGAIKSLLSEEPKSHTLTLRRGAQHLDVTVTLRRLI